MLGKPHHIHHHTNMCPKCSPQLITQHPGVEPIKYYRKGGFHLIHVNNILWNYYHIVNKLAYGVYGTIWLVNDLASGRCTALKVLVAKASKEVTKVAILYHLKQWQLNDGDSNGQEFLMKFCYG